MKEFQLNNDYVLENEENALFDRITKIKYCMITNFKYEASKNNLFLFSCDNLTY